MQDTQRAVNDVNLDIEAFLAARLKLKPNEVCDCLLYTSLTELIPELMDMVDEKKIALNPAYELSFLKKEEQVDLLDAMDSEQATPSLSQAQRLKKYSQEGHLTPSFIIFILSQIRHMGFSFLPN